MLQWLSIVPTRDSYYVLQSSFYLLTICLDLTYMITSSPKDKLHLTSSVVGISLGELKVPCRKISQILNLDFLNFQILHFSWPYLNININHCQLFYSDILNSSILLHTFNHASNSHLSFPLYCTY